MISLPNLLLRQVLFEYVGISSDTEIYKFGSLTMLFIVSNIEFGSSSNTN